MFYFICRNKGFFCTAVYCAAYTSQAEANQSTGIHRDAFYQMSALYNWGFLTAGFSICLVTMVL